MEHLTSLALDRVTQMPLHLSIPAIGYSADDEFENHFFTHNGIDFGAIPDQCEYLAGTHLCGFRCVCLRSSRPSGDDAAHKKCHFFPGRIQVTEQLRGIIHHQDWRIDL